MPKYIKTYCDAGARSVKKLSVFWTLYFGIWKKALTLALI